MLRCCAAERVAQCHSPGRAAAGAELTKGRGGGGGAASATGHYSCCGIVLLWPGRDHRQPFLQERDLATVTMTP